MTTNGSDSEIPSEVLAMAAAASDVRAVPPEAGAVLKDIDTACGDLLRRLGALEADYVNTKTALLEELKSRRSQFKALVDDTAKKTGIDITRERWNIDLDKMTLSRVN